METEKLDELREERGSVYGDIRENHEGIAQMIAPILQPHAKRIAEGKPLPAWVITLIMVLIKCNRMRLTYHEDNFYDASNYLRFTRDLQREDFTPPQPPADRWTPGITGAIQRSGWFTRLRNKVKKLTGWS